MGIASLILGIISLVIGFVPLCGAIALLPAIVGLILGITDVGIKSKNGEKKGQALAGLIMSAIAIVIIIFWVFVASNTDTTNVNNQTIQTSTKIEPTEQAQQNQSETKQEEKKDYTEVDYEVLYQDYQDNAIGADAKYRDKILRLTGEIYDINRGITGNPYVIFRVGGQYSFKDVRINFKKSEEEKVANFKKGETITIQGKCLGQLATGAVSLTDCEIIK